MNYNSFKYSLEGTEPTEPMSVYLKALWFDAKGDWNKAHELIQDLSDKNSALIHAYLHRKEGDSFNADYWYRRAGKERPKVSLKEEWEQFAKALTA